MKRKRRRGATTPRPNAADAKAQATKAMTGPPKHKAILAPVATRRPTGQD